MMGAKKAMSSNVRRIGIGVGAAALACGVLSAAAIKVPAFRFPLTEASRLVYEGEIRGTPVASGNSVFFTTDKGFVYSVAVGPAPSVAWRFAAKAPLLGPPVLGEKGILAADASNRVYLLDPSTGLPRWELALTARITGGPVWGPGDAVFLTADNAYLLALDVRGLETWRFAPGPALCAGPALVAGEILIGTGEGRISVLGADGRLRRTYETGGPIAAPLFVDRGRVYVSRADGTLLCLDPASGKIRWKLLIGGTLTAAPAAGADRLFITVSSGALFCLNAKRGDLIWWHSLPAKSPFSAWVGEGLAVAASRSPVLAAFKADNGDKGGTFDAGSELRAGAARAGDRLLINLYDPDSGRGTLVFLKNEPPKTPAPGKK
jgi:outer membrane protein assembly factor BamB